MAEVSMTQVVALLDVLQRFREIQQGSLDGAPISVEDSRVHASLDRIRLAVTFLCDGARHQVEADHDWRDTRNVIRVDGRDVEKDEVDLEFDGHPERVDLEYRLGYRQDGAPHQLVLTARVGL